MTREISSVFRLGRRVTVFPVIHGSGDFAVAVRRFMLQHRFDCLAVPLPPSFQEATERGTDRLPRTGAVICPPEIGFQPDSEDHATASYVPVDPCQPVIAALRIALQERIPRAFIDIDEESFDVPGTVLPDPWAVRRVSAERFAAAVLPTLHPPRNDLQTDRIRWMACELHRLTQRYEAILLVCGMQEWPWIRDAFQSAVDRPPEPPPSLSRPELYSIAANTLLFVLGELPFITGLYEQARVQLDDDENLSIDGVKALLLAARDRYRSHLGRRARPVTPHLLRVSLKYMRNLSLLDRRFTPDLYTLVTAVRQTMGDSFAIHAAEVARSYPFSEDTAEGQEAAFSIDRLRLPDGRIFRAVSRLPGHPVVWRTCRLQAPPDRRQRAQWRKAWNPFGQCSWPPEDASIERFRTHVKDTALTLLGNDLARTEKFCTSLKDGLDLRETLRNWHTGDLYVREYPPVRGNLDCVVMLFDSPADPRDYPWRITWHAESHDESTLSLFATDFRQELIGPGIALARYGGCMFLFPPRPIPDIFRDPRFDFTNTLEERLLAAAMFHSRETHIALLSPAPPGAGWRRLARRFRKKLIHVPLNRFGTATIERLRTFHVLNGQHVRSYAARFIREP